MWRQLAPLRNKIVFALVCNVSLLLLFCVPLWHVWTGTILTGRLESLHMVAARMTAVFEKRGVETMAMEIDDWVRSPASHMQSDFAVYGQLFRLLAPDGSDVAGNVRAIQPVDPDEHGLYVTTVSVGQRQASAELIRQALPGGYQLWIGRDMTRFDRLETIFLRGMVGTSLITMVAALVAAWAGRRSTLDRMEMTNRAMAAIVDGDLSQRLPETHSGDAFDVLARTVNGMLEQLDVLVQNVKQSSNAIAHDLRTPLAELRGDLEQLAFIRPSSDEMLAGIELAISDVDHVIAIFNALLRLADIDSGTRRASFRPVDVGLLVQEAAEFYGPVAEEKGNALRGFCEPGLVIPGDALLLAQAIGNLIDNALKYGAGACIVLDARRSSTGLIEIAVADHGPGIPDSEKSKVTDRFYRMDSGRTSPGAGLGLALVDAVIKLHGGTFELRDNAPGLRAVLILAGIKPDATA